MNILVMDDIERDRSVLIDKAKKWGVLHSVPLTIQEMSHAACNSPAMRTYQDVDYRSDYSQGDSTRPDIWQSVPVSYFLYFPV